MLNEEYATALHRMFMNAPISDIPHCFFMCDTSKTYILNTGPALKQLCRVDPLALKDCLHKVNGQPTTAVEATIDDLKRFAYLTRREDENIEAIPEVPQEDAQRLSWIRERLQQACKQVFISELPDAFHVK